MVVDSDDFHKIDGKYKYCQPIQTWFGNWLF